MKDKSPVILRVTLSDGTNLHFTQAFTVGRHPNCDISIKDGVVSRRHAGIVWENGDWWIQDLNSANGVFVNGQRIDRATLFGMGRIQLGAGGPTLFFDIEAPPSPSPIDQPPIQPPQAKTAATTLSANEPPSLDHYKDHYFGKTLDQGAGQHTMMVRRAFAEVQKKQRMTYGIIIGLVVLLLVVASGVAWYKHSQVVEQRQLAAEVFYTMRALEIDLIKLRVEAEKRKSLEARKQIEAANVQKKKLEQSYERYVDSLDIYSKGLSEKKRLSCAWRIDSASARSTCPTVL
jgi:membrane-bound lytic murein transglycosylase D